MFTGSPADKNQNEVSDINYNIYNKLIQYQHDMYIRQALLVICRDKPDGLSTLDITD